MVSDAKLRLAFVKVKTDILALQREITKLHQEQTKLALLVRKPQKTVVVRKTVVKKVAAKKAKPTKRAKAEKKSTIVIASKSGKRFFEPSSVHAQAIKKENQIVFKTKEAAMKAGYKPAKV